MAAFSLFKRLGMKRAQRRMGAVRFMVTSSSFGDIGLATVGDVKSISRWIPALLINMLRLGKRVLAQRNRFLLSDSRERSHCLMLRAGSWCFAASSLLLRRPQTITTLPSLWKFSAKAKPIPVAPPVMRTVFPLISKPTSAPSTSALIQTRCKLPTGH